MLTRRLRFQGNAWADIPAEVIEEVLDKLSAKDRWNSRLISSSWGLVVRGYKGNVVIPINASTLWSRATSFRQRQKQYPRTRFTIKWAKPLGFAPCAEVLATIAAKARRMDADSRDSCSSVRCSHQQLMPFPLLTAGRYSVKL